MVYSQIEKRDECKVINDDWSQIQQLMPNCSDINSEGILMVDAAQSKDNKEIVYI